MVPLPNGKDLHAVGRICSKIRAAAMRPFRLSARLILEIDVGELLSVIVANNEAGSVQFLDSPRRREAARQLTIPKGKDRPFHDSRPLPMLVTAFTP
jgi:hypothetical protein